ncbi:uncharacterized protein A4U43_C05F9410 [Asparagus officinalis]|uniref:Uncharacterized protein n=1 Tax=Asparagus officinalis TaxID=4686 RepID=A0A5P1EQG8_ASPOF|nr:uncharacterized protein A4U43_C05F9410 [Asparagus officinalis]
MLRRQTGQTNSRPMLVRPLWVIGGEVEDGGVAIAGWDFEIDGENEGLHGLGFGVGPADSVIGPAQDVVQAGCGAEPVDTGGLEEELRGIEGSLEGSDAIDGENEGLHGLGFGVGPADSVIGLAQDVVQAGCGAEPVDAGGLEEVRTRWGFVAAGEVAFGAEFEEVAGHQSLPGASWDRGISRGF